MGDRGPRENNGERPRVSLNGNSTHRLGASNPHTRSFTCYTPCPIVNGHNGQGGTVSTSMAILFVTDQVARPMVVGDARELLVFGLRP